MRITVSVMAHQSRKEQAAKLFHALEEQGFSYVHLSVWKGETGKEGEWKNGAYCWEYGKGAEWHIVIQDDAIIGPNFYANAKAAFEAVPEKTCLSFYTGRAKPYKHRVQEAVFSAGDASFLKFDLLLWGVCVAIKGEHIEQMLRFADSLPSTVEYDRRISEYFRVNNIPVYYSNPSIADHADGESLLGHSAQERRVAHSYQPDKIEWNSKAHDI